MPRKRSEASHFEKVFFLFELFFLREPREWTVQDLLKRFKAKGWDCAPNTIRNLIDDLRRAMGDHVIEERRRGKKTYYYPTVRYQRKMPGDISALSLVDYTPHSSKLETLMKALEERLVCVIRYQALSGKEKIHCVLPLKAVSHQDVIYVYAWRYPDPKELRNEEVLKGERAPGYHILFAFHRIKSVNLFRNEAGKRVRIEDYAPEQREFLKKLHERCFGLIKKNKFRVRVRFDKSVELYLKERRWSEGEEYPVENELVFWATSPLEVKSWALSFGRNLVLLEPEDLRREILKELKEMQRKYAKAKECP